MKFKDRKIKTHIDIINIYNTIKEKEIKIDNSEVLAEFISNTNEIEQVPQINRTVRKRITVLERIVEKDSNISELIEDPTIIRDNSENTFN
jgi:hypothetical protein